MKAAIDMSRGVKSDIEIGICGEHGGDPKSIEFCSTLASIMLAFISQDPNCNTGCSPSPL